jgi:type I restriction enzyme S subunit
MNEKVQFYKETKFRKTEIGKIPEDWDINEVGNIFGLYKGTTPSTKVPEYWNGKIPFVIPTDITALESLNKIFLEKTQKYITEQGLKSKGLKLVPRNSLLLSSRATIGYLAINKIRVAINQGIISLFPKEKKTDLIFFYYLFLSLRNHLKSLSGGSTFKEISISNFRNVKVPLPPLSEQQKIASILLTIHEAIRKTDEMIERAQELKRGLMQRLLIKGIGHTKFKTTEVGEIPEEWEVVKLKNVILEVKSGFACGKRDRNGILQLRMDSIDAEGWINTEAGVMVPIPKDVEKYLLRPGDVLFNNTNSVDLIGKTAIFKGEFPKCVYSNHLTRIRVNSNEVIPEWILYLLIRKWRRGVFKAICHRHVHQAGINNRDLLSLKIPLPSLSEQREIVSILLAIDDKIGKEKQTKEQLEKTKRWFMQNLLTGKIRVKVN